MTKHMTYMKWLFPISWLICVLAITLLTASLEKFLFTQLLNYLTYSLNVSAVLRGQVTATFATFKWFLPKPTVCAEPIFYPLYRMPKMSI